MWFYIYSTHAKSRRQTLFPFKLFWVGPFANFCYTYFVLSEVHLKQKKWVPWDLQQSASPKATRKSAVGPEVENTREMCKMSRQWEVIIWSLWFRQDVDPREMLHSLFGATSRCLPSCGLSSWTIHPCCVFDDVQWQFPRQQQQLSHLLWGGQMEKTIKTEGDKNNLNISLVFT